MLIVAIRTLILYAAVLFAVRLMGKSELSKMSPFQMVILFMIAELAAIPIDSTSASLINGVMAIFTLMFLQIAISFLATKWEWFKALVTDKPSVLIEKGKLNEKEIRRLRITSTDLMEQLRLGNCPSLSDVQYAIMESNGQLTIIPKAKLYEQNLHALGMSREMLDSKLRKAGLADYQRVFLAFYDENKRIHLYLRDAHTLPFASEVVL